MHTQRSLVITNRDFYGLLGMIQKDSHRFNTYCGVRIGEIQERSNTYDWYWTNSENNFADWTTRGKSPCELHANSQWQRGPSFLSLPELERPLRQTFEVLAIPEVIRAVMTIVTTQQSDSLPSRIDINRYSSHINLIRVTARVLSMYRPSLSFRNILNQPTQTKLNFAIEFWIRDAQLSIGEVEKRFANLGPIRGADGIFRVGQRVQKWTDYTYNKSGLVLLPGEHKLSYLYAMYMHSIGHNGVMATMSKIRLRFWVTNLNRVVTNLVKKYVTCRKNAHILEEQIMAPLPLARLKPFHPFYIVAVDFFWTNSHQGRGKQKGEREGIWRVIHMSFYTSSFCRPCT